MRGGGAGAGWRGEGTGHLAGRCRLGCSWRMLLANRQLTRTHHPPNQPSQFPPHPTHLHVRQVLVADVDVGGKDLGQHHHLLTGALHHARKGALAQLDGRL